MNLTTPINHLEFHPDSQILGMSSKSVKDAFRLIHLYGTFRLTFHLFDHFELDLRGDIHVRGAALSCVRLKLADIVLI